MNLETTRFIGIDPGLTGGVAILPDELVLATPTTLVGTHRRYLAPAMAAILRPYATSGSPVYVALESVHSMPRQGVASSFTFGRGFGLWEGILAALGIPYDLVPPQRWKRVMLDGLDKSASRLRAMQLFPALAPQLSLKRDTGKADALLLAEYRRRQG